MRSFVLYSSDPATTWIYTLSLHDALPISGVGIKNVLEAVVAHMPSPRGNPDAPARGLIFDSHYDAYKGVIAYVKMVDGSIDRKSTRLNSSHVENSYAVFCLKKKK